MELIVVSAKRTGKKVRPLLTSLPPRVSVPELVIKAMAQVYV